MNSLLIILGSLVLFILAYRIYTRFLSRVYQLDSRNKTPAYTKSDGVDYIPAKSWLVLFGHHFSSICGAGPIVGPVLAVAYWGWAPSLLWILVGVVLMGAVADFSSLVLSVRAGGVSISEVAKPEISPRARLLFSWFIWLTVILVITVFAIFGAKTLVKEPQVVLPSMGLIPVAVLTGWILYRVKVNTIWGTLLGLSLLVGLLVYGRFLPLELPSLFGLTSTQVWIIVLLIYCVIASVTPVNILLQPRDYIASYLLFFTIAVGLISIAVVQPSMDPQSLHHWYPKEAWPAAGPLFPMLFVTIACGAISGFHSLVASGTTCKQIADETHSCRIGYGGMLMEGVVAVMVLICVAAGLSRIQLGSILGSGGGGPIAAFGEGFGNLSSFIMGDYGKVFACLALNTFILTTLDSATRIARYLTMDLFKIKDKYLATIIVVVVAGALALSGHWSRIWPAFGTANQLIAGLALLVASCWLIKRKKPSIFTLIPSIIMLIVTTTAFIYQIIVSINKTEPDYLIAGVASVLIILSAVVFWESVGVLRTKKK